MVERWGPQVVFLNLPIFEKIRKIVGYQIPTWTQTTCDFQTTRHRVIDTWYLRHQTYEHLYWFDILDLTDLDLFQ